MGLGLIVIGDLACPSGRPAFVEQPDKAHDAESSAQSQYRPDDHTTSLFITFVLFALCCIPSVRWGTLFKRHECTPQEGHAVGEGSHDACNLCHKRRERRESCPSESEQFGTPDDSSFVKAHLQGLSKTAGSTRIRARSHFFTITCQHGWDCAFFVAFFERSSRGLTRCSKSTGTKRWLAVELARATIASLHDHEEQSP